MNQLAPFDSGKLLQAVERARSLFDEGDVESARILAGGAYDQAQAAARFAGRFSSAEELAAPLVNKARRLQGEALLIEAQAKIRLAIEWDAARASGVALKGRPKSVSTEERLSVADTGLSRKEIHEARKLRDAEREAPGIVERAIQARLEAGLEPSRASLRANIGTKSATREERGRNLYETPVEAMCTLLALERFSLRVLEPACGKGAILRPLEDAGYEVLISDLIDYGTTTRHGECQAVEDFLQTTATADMDIVTNPPYGDVLNAFVAHALRVHRPRKMALLLNLNFLCGFEDPDRCFAMDENPPARVHVFSRRLPMMHRDGWEGPHASSSMNTAWFVWEQDRHGRYSGPTRIHRVDWKDFEARAPLPPLVRPAKPAAHDDLIDKLIEAEAARVASGRTAKSPYQPEEASP